MSKEDIKPIYCPVKGKYVYMILSHLSKHWEAHVNCGSRSKITPNPYCNWDGSFREYIATRINLTRRKPCRST